LIEWLLIAAALTQPQPPTLACKTLDFPEVECQVMHLDELARVIWTVPKQCRLVSGESGEIWQRLRCRVPPHSKGDLLLEVRIRQKGVEHHMAGLACRAVHLRVKTGQHAPRPLGKPPVKAGPP
jgi:hypothetical protein